MRVYAEQLISAWESVKRGSQAAGVDGMTVELFSGIAQEQIRLMQRQLQRECYSASPAKGFYLAKPTGGHRLIGISTVRDRILQRYLLQAIYPKLESVYTQVCHAYRLGYSIHTAVAQVMEAYQYQPAWIVKTDIQQFFDRLVWSLLLSQGFVA
jgi:retron-type reverse transcriptase